MEDDPEDGDDGEEDPDAETDPEGWNGVPQAGECISLSVGVGRVPYGGEPYGDPAPDADPRAPELELAGILDPVPGIRQDEESASERETLTVECTAPLSSDSLLYSEQPLPSGSPC